jgi:hypothetical protein
MESKNVDFIIPDSKIAYITDSKELNAKITIINKSDKFLILSAHVFGGIEVGKVYVTNDSIIFLNRIEKEYYIEKSKNFNFYDECLAILNDKSESFTKNIKVDNKMIYVAKQGSEYTVSSKDFKFIENSKIIIYLNDRNSFDASNLEISIPESYNLLK